MQDVFKLAEEALVSAHTTLYQLSMEFCHVSEIQPFVEQEIAVVMPAITAIRAARAEWHWQPLSEWDDTDRQQVHVGRSQGNTWDVNMLSSRLFAMACGYTHFCRPHLPPPPAREEVGNG